MENFDIWDWIIWVLSLIGTIILIPLIISLHIEIKEEKSNFFKHYNRGKDE